jgi:hypothetical protein
VGDSLEPRAEALGGVVASAITVWLLLRARAAYQRALADALRAGRPQPFVLEADPFGALRTDADALAVTVAGLRDADPVMRRVSAEVLRLLALPSTADALISAIDDPDEDVRRSAVRGLAALGLADPIARFANDPDPEIRVSVALTRGPQAIAALAMNSDAAVRRAVAAAIAERGGPPAALVMLLDDRDASVRHVAGDALQTTVVAPADLEPLLGSADAFVAGRALDALAARADPAMRARLVALARGASMAAASECDRLRRIGVRSDEAGAFVVDAVRERARRPALRAVHAALALGGRGDADLVIESLESRDRERRAGAVELIEAVGGDLVRPLLPLWEETAAPTAGRDLEDIAASDPDTLVRDAARRAISGGMDMKAETLPTISLVERVLFLRRVSLFAELAPSDLKQIAGLAREEQHVDGAVLGREGEVGDRLFVIVSGTVRVASGERVIARRRVGDVIGEMSVVTDAPRIASLICEGDARVLSIGRRDFDAILRDRPQVAHAIIRVLSARIAEQQRAA